jgi:hypothetical protein
MVVPSEELCGHHGLPNRAFCLSSRHHERSILWSADSAVEYFSGGRPRPCRPFVAGAA